jgi:hypothetical protein
MCCDLIRQLHAGSAVEKGRRKHMRWDVDGPNSLLHMAISVTGHRTLHS